MKDAVVNFDVDLSKWNVEQPLSDVLWVLMLDEPDTDHVTLSSGIVLQTQQKIRGHFRIGKALKVGPNVKTVKEGDFLLIPPNTGMLGHKSEQGYKTLFIKEDYIMSVINFNGSKDDYLKHQAEDLFAQV